MSKAVPGNGKIREEVAIAGQKLREASMTYMEIVLADEAKTRNHMSAEASEEQIDTLSTTLREVTEAIEVMAKARDHHRAQTSVLPNNLLGQRRRIKGGQVVIVDPVDPVKMAETMGKYGWNDLTAEQQATFMVRASNPDRKFFDAAERERKAYLAGAVFI
jgi:hypothetical protein